MIVDHMHPVVKGPTWKPFHQGLSCQVYSERWRFQNLAMCLLCRRQSPPQSLLLLGTIPQIYYPVTPDTNPAKYAYLTISYKFLWGPSRTIKTKLRHCPTGVNASSSKPCVCPSTWLCYVAFQLQFFFFFFRCELILNFKYELHGDACKTNVIAL